MISVSSPKLGLHGLGPLSGGVHGGGQHDRPKFHEIRQYPFVSGWRGRTKYVYVLQRISDDLTNARRPPGNNHEHAMVLPNPSRRIRSDGLRTSTNSRNWSCRERSIVAISCVATSRMSGLWGASALNCERLSANSSPLRVLCRLAMIQHLRLELTVLREHAPQGGIRPLRKTHPARRRSPATAAFRQLLANAGSPGVQRPD